MVDIKNAQRVACKACQGGQVGIYKIYSYHELLMHFKLVHVDAARNTQNPPADWKEDMLELPGRTFMRQMRDELTGKARDMFLQYFGILVQDSPQLEDQCDPRHPGMHRGLDGHGRQEEFVRPEVTMFDVDSLLVANKSTKASRIPSVRTSNGQARYPREIEGEDGTMYRLVPRDQYRDEGRLVAPRLRLSVCIGHVQLTSDVDEEPHYHDDHAAGPCKRRRPSRAHQQHPRIKQEPRDDDDDDYYAGREHRILGAARRR